MKPIARDLPILADLSSVDSDNLDPFQKQQPVLQADWESMSGASSSSPSANSRSSSLYRKLDENHAHYGIDDGRDEMVASPTSPRGDVIIVTAPPSCKSSVALPHARRLAGSEVRLSSSSISSSRARSTSSTETTVSTANVHGTQLLAPDQQQHLIAGSKVVHFVDPQSGVTLFKAKVPLLPNSSSTATVAPAPSPSTIGVVTMKDLAKASLKRFITKFQLSPSTCSIRGMQILGNGASLCSADRVQSVVGANEEVVLMTNIADQEARARVLAQANAPVAAATLTASSPPTEDMTQVLTSSLSVNSQQLPQQQRKKREREGEQVEGARRQLQNARRTTPAQHHSTSQNTDHIKPSSSCVALFTVEEVNDAVKRVDTIISEKVLMGLFSHAQAMRRSLDLTATAGRAR
ncbi:Hypothetical protein, putative [Bodo saltans]|uniref:Uncharacterized protein n=1 Tax=Bodo saltans TaxID=75058 RepID=A0A0S4JD89_BODSA|nr:Hypothetical protein, putative [Bodo saltans]|eukprot:CUG87160.1 Hypothetical protein, putative [Bodo saltans]